MIKQFALAFTAFAAMAAPGLAADVADMPACLQPRTLASATRAVSTEVLVAQGSAPRFSDPACTYSVARPQPPVFEEQIRGLW